MYVCIYIHILIENVSEEDVKQLLIAAYTGNRVSVVCARALQETPSGTPSDAERHSELTLN
jgi:hypothetical protein